MVPVPTLWLLAQALTERNPASRLIWIVGGVALLVLSLIVVVEIVDHLRDAFRRRQVSWSDDPGADPEPEDGDTGIHLREPKTPLRHRFFSRFRPQRRTWSEGRANEPSKHWRSRKPETRPRGK